jgi:integrase
MGNKFYVYYYHPMLKKADGKPEQMYEDFTDEESALKRKDEIEYYVPEDKRPFLSETTLGYVMRNVSYFFKMAVKWKGLGESPVDIDIPKAEDNHRDFMQPEQYEIALEDIDDPLLHLAVHIAFRCTLRVGEICALDWDQINYQQKEVTFSKNLVRSSQSALEKASKLMQRHRMVGLDKARYGKRYNDFNLVFAMMTDAPLTPVHSTKGGKSGNSLKEWSLLISILFGLQALRSNLLCPVETSNPPRKIWGTKQRTWS